jgi:hypothetical protein
LAAKVITYRRVEWAIDSFAPYKTPGIDGIFPALSQEGWDVFVPYWSGYFVPACLLAMFQPYGGRLR